MASRIVKIKKCSFLKRSSIKANKTTTPTVIKHHKSKAVLYVCSNAKKGTYPSATKYIASTKNNMRNIILFNIFFMTLCYHENENILVLIVQAFRAVPVQKLFHATSRVLTSDFAAVLICFLIFLLIF